MKEKLDKEDANMYCRKCGKQIPEDAKFCPECGSVISDMINHETPEQVAQTPSETDQRTKETSNAQGLQLTCEKCNSTNVSVQAKNGKKHFILGFVLLFSGFGLMLFGFLGAIIGFLIGLLMGVIVNAVTPEIYETVIICQDCGHITKTTQKKSKKQR